jgi:hypothetical protein
MSKDSIKAILSVLVVLAFVIILDLVVGVAGSAAFKNLPDNEEEFSREKYSISKTEAECIILGSSHASHHYNPEILSDSLQMTVYNAGRGGHGITYSLALFKAILSRYTPKLVVLDVKYEESDEWISRVRDLKPYFKDYPVAFETDVMVNGDRERYRMMWNSYVYNSTLITLVNTYLVGSNGYKCNGYSPIPNTGKKNAKLKEQEESVQVANALYKDCFMELSSLCNEKGIILITVSSPTLVRFKYQSPAIPIIDSLGLIYLDHFNDEYFLNHTELFRDGDHLFENGADLFTSIVGSEIKNIINKKYY